MGDHVVLRSFLAAHRAEAVAFLAALVRQPSDNPPGDCAAHAALAASLLEAMGLHVERHPIPPDDASAHGMASCVNLVVRAHFGRGQGPTIALAAHGDVVPPGERWSVDPYGAEVGDGVMYGRGVAVSKSDFATYAFAPAPSRWPCFPAAAELTVSQTTPSDAACACCSCMFFAP